MARRSGHSFSYRAGLSPLTGKGPLCQQDMSALHRIASSSQPQAGWQSTLTAPRRQGAALRRPHRFATAVGLEVIPRFLSSKLITF